MSPLASVNGSFVTRAGWQLELDGQPFRVGGTNIYWLGLDENVGGIAYPTFFRIRNALETAKAMGFMVVRSHMFVSSGHQLTLRPFGCNDVNRTAFNATDYAIARARSLGLRLMLPLTDQWEYYHGGHRDFTAPYGLPAEAFYTDERVVAEYLSYISAVFDHVNNLTGLVCRDDPTILAWELGNELNGMTHEWTNRVAAAIRNWAPHQLVAAGAQFGVDPAALASPDVDIIDVHYYPPSPTELHTEQIHADAATVAEAGKVFVVGEYRSTSARADVLRSLADDPHVSGALSWSLFGHDDSFGFVQHDDGLTMHYPGDHERMASSIDAQIEFARAMSGTDETFTLAKPLITGISRNSGGCTLAWRGAAGAVGYRVERSVRGPSGPWTAAHDGFLSDHDAPWTDISGADCAWYRVVPIDRRGTVGASSEPKQ